MADLVYNDTERTIGYTLSEPLWNVPCSERNDIETRCRRTGQTFHVDYGIESVENIDENKIYLSGSEGWYDMKYKKERSLRAHKIPLRSEDRLFFGEDAQHLEVEEEDMNPDFGVAYFNSWVIKRTGQPDVLRCLTEKEEEDNSVLVFEGRTPYVITVIFEDETLHVRMRNAATDVIYHYHVLPHMSCVHSYFVCRGELYFCDQKKESCVTHHVPSVFRSPHEMHHGINTNMVYGYGYAANIEDGHIRVYRVTA
jgi:hypothetical protein